jgi:heat-inducible transcriptional repressor
MVVSFRKFLQWSLIVNSWLEILDWDNGWGSSKHFEGPAQCTLILREQLLKLCRLSWFFLYPPFQRTLLADKHPPPETHGLKSPLRSLDERSREIFRTIVESYLETGAPVGSRTLSRTLPMSLSPASIRNVMADLEDHGLLTAPHTSAGRLPSHLGLRMFVDGFMQMGDLTQSERSSIEGQLAAGEKRFEEALVDATSMLSGLSHCAGLVITPKREGELKQIEFVALDPGRALAVLVWQDGAVENRVLELPVGLTSSVLVRAANYINARLSGVTLSELRVRIAEESDTLKGELDTLSAQVVEKGLAVWSGSAEQDDRALIVRGQSNLLDELTEVEDLERIRRLLDDLERKGDVMQLLNLAQDGEGVKIFIGAETKLFSLSGSSVIVSPYTDGEKNVVGAIGIIGPTRLNYARLIPMVDFTAQAIGKFLT